MLSQDHVVTVEEEARSLWKVFLHSLEDKEIRGFILVYLISNGVFKTIQMISVFFMEQSWEQEGLGISTKNLSIVTFLSYFPSVVILMGSPKIVPRFFGYKNFI